MGKLLARRRLVHMADQHAVNLLRLSVGEFVNIGVTVRAPQVAVGAVHIHVFSDIQEFEFALLVVIAQAPVFMAEEAVFLVNSIRR